MRKAFFLFEAAMVLVVAFAGCSRYVTYPVEGRVTFPDGSPAANCRVTLEGGDPLISATGVTDADGNFSLGTVSESDGVPVGKYRVVVVDPPPFSPQTKPLPEVALKHASFETSGLEVTVQRGPNRLDIQVERWRPQGRPDDRR